MCLLSTGRGLCVLFKALAYTVNRTDRAVDQINNQVPGRDAGGAGGGASGWVLAERFPVLSQGSESAPSGWWHLRKGLKEAASTPGKGVLGGQRAGAKALGPVCAWSHAGQLPSTI